MWLIKRSFYRTQVRSLAMLVSNSLTDSVMFSKLDGCEWCQLPDDVVTVVWVGKWSCKLSTAGKGRQTLGRWSDREYLTLILHVERNFLLLSLSLWGYEDYSWSRFWSYVWSRFWSLSLAAMLIFGWGFEVAAWSRIWRWNLIKVYLRTCDMT